MQVGQAHAAALAAIHEAAFPRDQIWNLRAISDLLATPGVRGWLDPAGGMLLARIAADEAEILTLAVVPAVRRRGIARGLLSVALAELSRLAPGAVYLEVSVLNAAAAGLYAGLGFKPVGERARYYSDGSAALVLKLSLCE